MVILIGTGSELYLCMDAQKKLLADGIPTRVVSMPCQELFDDQLPSTAPVSCPPTARFESPAKQEFVRAGTNTSVMKVILWE